MFSLADLCLNAVTEAPARCLRIQTDAADATHPALLRCVPDGFEACVQARAWPDRWSSVEASTDNARRRARSEARPQLVATLCQRGALVDGVLPPRFFEGLRVDALSLAACRARAPFVMLAGARVPLTCLDLGSCLQLDDAILQIVMEACGLTLKRLNVRDCRKLTDLAFEALKTPVLEDLDVGGNFNMTLAGASSYVTAKRKCGDDRCLAALSVAGFGADDAFLATLARKVPSLKVLGCGYGRFTAIGFAQICLQTLVDVRVQWSEGFDDACLEALANVAPLQCLNCLGTQVTVDAVTRFLQRKVHDATLGPQPSRCLEYLNCRYTAGPREKLEKLPKQWRSAAVEIVAAV